MLHVAEARWRIGLRLLAACAEALGVDVPEWEDPADTVDGIGDEDSTPGRDADPAGRAAQIRAFITATGGEES